MKRGLQRNSASRTRNERVSAIHSIGFDPAIYRRLNPDLVGLTDEQATEHFFSFGIEELRPFNHEYIFSPSFYAEMYTDTAEMSPAAAYQHWLTLGVREQRFPSPDAFLRSFGVTAGDVPDDFSVERYISPYPDLAKMSRYEGFRHFVEHGLREGRASPFPPGEGVLTLRELSDMYLRQGNHALAAACLDRILSASPDNASALQAYGDIQLKLGCNFVARDLYSQARSIDPTYFWTAVNGAIAAQSLGLHDEAIDLFGAARRIEPGLEMPRQRLRHAAATRFNIALLDAAMLASSGQKHDSREKVRKAIADYSEVSDDLALPPPDRVRFSESTLGKPRVAMVAAHLIPVCWEYRVRQRELQMAEAGYEFRAWAYPDIEDFCSNLHLYDVAIFFRLPAEPGVLDAIKYAGRLGVTTIYEIDDLIFDEVNYPPPFETFSGMVDKLWYSGLVGSAVQHHEALKLCDYGIASTPALQNAISAIVRKRKAFLHRNALNEHKSYFATQSNVRRDSFLSDSVVAFYGSGSKSHNENFNSIAAPALAEAFKNHPEFRLLVTGPLVFGETLLPYKDRIEHLDFISDQDHYQSLLASADINLAPLTQSVFNDCKSEIKWLEAAVHGIPSIVSASDTYNRTLTSGIDALVPTDVNEWVMMLDRLISDPSLRKHIGAAAREKAVNEYTLEPMSDNLRTIVGNISEDDTVRLASPKKRLLIVNTHFAPQSIGGATRSVEGIVEQLIERYSHEFDVEVFCAQQYGRPGNIERYSALGVNVTTLAPWDRPDLGVGDIDENVAKVFWDYLERFPVDLIHFHAMQLLSASPLNVAQSMGIPYVVTAHDGWWLSSHPFLADAGGRLVMESGDWGDRARIARLAAQLENASAVIAPSRTFADLYRARGIHKTEVSQNGVSIGISAEAPPSNGPVVIGLLGGLGVAKGADLLLQALRLRDFPNLRFVVIDHAAPSSSKRTEYWGGAAVEIIGRVAQSNIGELYGRLHVVLAISVCAESFGLVAREALSLHRWVVASDRGAVGEDIAPGKNGFKIDVSTPIPLVEVLTQINDRPDIYRLPSEGSPALKSISEQVDHLVDIYRRVLCTVEK